MIDTPNGSYVLIVDDDEEDVFAFKWAMEAQGSKIETVHIDDGAQALDFLLSKTDPEDLPQIVLLDINMPGVDGFETLGAIRVEFKTDARNERSQNALRRIGAKEEGTLRKHMLVQGGYQRDSVYFSITDDDWPGVKARLLSKLGRN